MLPEAFVVALIVFPVCIHIGKEVGSTGGGKNGGDVGIGAIWIAVGIVCAVTMIGPKAVDCPGVGGAGRGVVVPELGLNKMRKQVNCGRAYPPYIPAIIGRQER